MTVQAKKASPEPQKPTTEEMSQPTTEDMNQPTTENTTEATEGEESLIKNYTRLKWIEMLLDTVGVGIITEEAVAKDSMGAPQYSYADTGETEHALIVETAVREGILIPTDGTGDNDFHPEQLATREFAAVTAVRLLGYRESTNALECNDLESMEYPLWDAVAVNIGLIGLQDGYFNGKVTVTGEEGKQILAKVKELKAEETAIPEKVVDIQYADDLIKDTVSDLTDYLITETEIGYQIVINNYTDSMEERGIEAGKAIYLPADIYGKYQDGFVCRVAGTELSGQQLVINCTPIESIFDVVKTLRLSGDSIADEMELADGVTMKSVEKERISDDSKNLESKELQEDQMESKLSGISDTIVIPDGEFSLEKEIADNVTLGLNLKAPRITYDIKCDNNTIEKFKVVTTNMGTFSIKASASADTLAPDVKYDMFKSWVPVGGGFKVEFLFSLQASISGNISLTCDVTADLGVELQDDGKTMKGIAKFGAELGGNYEFSLSAGPEIDIVLCWLNDEFLKIADINLGYGYEFNSTTSSGMNAEGKELFCRNNSIRNYLYIGAGNVKDSLLNRMGISAKFTYNPKVYTDVHLESFSNFGGFKNVKECTAVGTNISGAVLDKDGNEVKFDSVIISSRIDPANKYYADNSTKGRYNCKVPNGDYTITAIWDGMIRQRMHVVVSDYDCQYDIKERDDIIDSGFGQGYAWLYSGIYNFDCEIDESADISEVKKAIEKYRSSIQKIYMYGVVGEQSLEGLFSECKNVTIMNLSGLNTEKAVNMSRMFYKCLRLSSLYLENWDTGNVTDMSGMFEECTGLKQLNISGFDTENVENMGSMFQNCNKLTKLDIKGLNTGKVTNMENMFMSCNRMITLDVSSFDTSKVTNMENMFGYCMGLTELNVSHFNTSAVTNMAGLFEGCSKLAILDVSVFDTSAVTNMAGLFMGCSNLMTLDLSYFNTSAVINMERMFKDCSNLSELNISSFNISNVKHMGNMFDNCKEEIVPSWYSYK